MNGLLICTGEGKTKNMGDFIQSVAQEQFFNHIDCYVEREKLDLFESKEKTKVIMNGWFMIHPEHFPPSSFIDPLFVSFHIAPVAESCFFTTKNIEYLKRYEPIGARDVNTKEMLERHGVNSYFSGCLTLALGLKYKAAKKSNEIIFVDPYFEHGWGNKYSKTIKVLSAFLLVLQHYRKVKKLTGVFINEERGSSKLYRLFGQWLKCASFYHSYSKIFDDELLFGASYITHQVSQNAFKDDDDKMEYAKGLIKRYAQAQLVITSRIHCAIPCLGIETPVIFVNSDALVNGDRRGAGRFGGLINFLHTIKWTQKGFIIESNDIASFIRNSNNSKIKPDVQFKNKQDYKPIRDKLINDVYTWLKK